ncbi:MAG: hypothetical protein LBU84_16005 [Prevotella sp.]|jgi:hypothetical protein|nr:hypothetical protein [Prevotella sp.]
MKLNLTKLQLIKSKNYLEGIERGEKYPFTEIVFMLFSTYRKGTKDWDDIQKLLDFLNLDNIAKVEEQDIPAIRQWLTDNEYKFEMEKDIEILVYRLLAAITDKKIFPYIDHHLIEDVNEKIKIKYTSVISFIDTTRIDQFKFTTI